MTIQELKDLVLQKIAGQGSQIDIGGALPPVLNGILDTLAATQSITQVNVTVDEGTGTPSAEASVADGVLTLNFHNLKGEKGEQGNTGSSVDYPFELVNNLTTDDATKALSAAQGVVLDNKVSQLGQEAIVKKLGENLFDKATAKIGYFIDSSGNEEANANYNASAFIPVVAGETYADASESGAPFRFVNFYDSNKAHTSTRISDQHTFTVPSGASYVRITFYAGNSYDNYAMVAKSSTRIPFESYNPIAGYEAVQIADNIVSTQKLQSKGVTLEKLGDDVIEEIESAGSIKNIKDHNSTNLVNPADILPGYWNTGYVASDSYKYVHLDISELQAGSTLTCLNSAGVAKLMRFCRFYNGNTYKSGVSDVNNTTIPDGVDNVYITFYVGAFIDGDNASVGVFNSATPTWSKYEEYIKALWTDKPSDPQALARIVDLPDGTDPVLNGKKWCPLGDSFTEGVTNTRISEGIYAGEKKVYPFFIGNRTGINVVKTFFAGGRTLAFPATPGDFTNSICNPSAPCYYQNIPEDVDYITIYLGINDSHHAPGSDGGDGEDNTGKIPIGTIDDATTATYYGAWNAVLSWLIENRPFAHIGIIVSNGCETAEYRTAQIAVARKYGIPFIDLNGDDRTPFMIRSTNTNIPSAIRTKRTQVQAVDYPSNTHPNDEAHEFESVFIENFLRTI